MPTNGAAIVAYPSILPLLLLRRGPSYRETEEGRRRIERNKRRPTTDTPALFTDGDGGADSVINRSHSESLNPVRVDEVSNRGNHSEGVPQDIRSQRRSICGEAAERRMLREQEDIEDRATMEDDKDEETFSTLNGGHGRDDIYAWNQSIREVILRNMKLVFVAEINKL